MRFVVDAAELDDAVAAARQERPDLFVLMGAADAATRFAGEDGLTLVVLDDDDPAQLVSDEGLRQELLGE